MEVALGILGVIVFIGGLMGYAIWVDKKRKEALRSVAEAMGLEFFPNGSAALQSELSGFKLFGTGRSRKLSKLIQGASDEVQISIFDYRYIVGGGKNSTTYTQTVATLRSQKLQVPSFVMRPENLLDKLGGMIGMADIDFESHPKFSSMFVLKGQNESAIRVLFKPRLLAFFEEKSRISIEATTGVLIFYRSRKTVSPQDIKGFLSEAYQVYGMLVDSADAVAGT